MHPLLVFCLFSLVSSAKVPRSKFRAGTKTTSTNPWVQCQSVYNYELLRGIKSYCPVLKADPRWYMDFPLCCCHPRRASMNELESTRYFCSKLLDCETEDVSVVSGDTKHEDFAVENLLSLDISEEQGTNYWLGPDDSEATFILNLGCYEMFNTIQLVNTHNGQDRDRSTKQLRIYTSLSSEGPWNQVLDTELEDSRDQPDPLQLQTVPLHVKGLVAAQFVKFELVSWWGTGGGLQYFDIGRESKLRGQCFKDDEHRLLFHEKQDGNNTIETCIKYCSSEGFSFAGVEDKDLCLCGNTAPPRSRQIPPEECSEPCSGNTNQTCGGELRMNAYVSDTLSARPDIPLDQCTSVVTNQTMLAQYPECCDDPNTTSVSQYSQLCDQLAGTLNYCPNEEDNSVTTTLVTSSGSSTTIGTAGLKNCFDPGLELNDHPECCMHPNIETVPGAKETCFRKSKKSKQFELSYCLQKVFDQKQLMRYSECSIHPDIIRRIPGAIEIGNNSDDVIRPGLLVKGFASKNKRRTRAGEGCVSTPIWKLNYCPYKFHVSNWSNQFPRCCCHPSTLSMDPDTNENKADCNEKLGLV